MPRTPSLRSLERIASEALGKYDNRVLQLSAAGVQGIVNLRRGEQEGQGDYARQYRSPPQQAYARPQMAQRRVPIAKWLMPIGFLLEIMGNRTYLQVMQAASLSGLFNEPIILTEEKNKYRLIIEPPVQVTSPHSNTAELGGLALRLFMNEDDSLNEKSTYVSWLPLSSGEERAEEIGKLVSGVEQLLSYYPNARVGVARMRANFKQGLRMYVDALAKASQPGR